MASGDPRDPQLGLPYVGSQVQQATRNGQSSTVLDMYAMKTVRLTQATNDNHYTADGHLYHE